MTAILDLSLEQLKTEWCAVDPVKGCWLWGGAKNKDGYGRTKRDGGSGLVFMHRHAWKLANKSEIPAGLVIRHRCNVRHCINPEHLSTGTQLENVRDRWPGRLTPKQELFGVIAAELEPGAKSPEEQLATARHLYEELNFEVRELAASFGVPSALLWKIVREDKWRRWNDAA